jgi:fimbrial chaperone protein
MIFKHWAAGCSLAAFFLWASAAPGAEFAVSKVLVDLSPQKPSDALTVSNDGEKPVVVQARLFAWSVEGEQETQSPTADLIVNPSIFTVPAGGQQILRIGMRKPLDPSRESSYRLELQEIPGNPEAAEAPAVRFVLRMSLPVFYGPQITAPRLSWQASQAGADSLRLTVRNDGNGYAKIGRIEVFQVGQDKPFVDQEVLVYVLAAHSRIFTVKASGPVREGRLQIVAHTSRGRIEANAVVEKP